MINSIRLQNFQAHTDTVLELHPGVNVIAGSSNSGKSSILRALNWVVYNRPSGEAFVSHWARDKKGNQQEDTSVTLNIGGTEITRRKSKATGNTYGIDDKVLEAIGLDVPEEITTLINFTEVNTQRQHDAPFLLSDSPGEVARFFNKIVHFDAIDKYLSSIESKKRKTKADAEMSKNNAERLGALIETYTWVQDAEQLLGKIGKQEDVLEALHDVELSQQIKEYQNIIERIYSLQGVTRRADKICKSISSKAPAMTELEAQCHVLQDSLVAHRKYADTIALDTGTAFAEKLVHKIERQKPLVSELINQCTFVQESIKEYQIAERLFAEAGRGIDELVKSLPSICPTCGKEL